MPLHAYASLLIEREFGAQEPHSMDFYSLTGCHSVDFNDTWGQFSLTSCMKFAALTVSLLVIGTKLCSAAVYQFLGGI